MEELFFEDVDAGAAIPNVVRKISLIDLMKYSAATWNFYLLHVEKEFAQKKGFKDVNVHGPLFGALLATTMTQWVGDPGGLKKLAYSARGMGFPGDTLTAKGTVVKKYQEAGENLVDCEVWVENQEGVKLVPGTATVALPSKEK